MELPSQHNRKNWKWRIKSLITKRKWSLNYESHEPQRSGAIQKLMICQDTDRVTLTTACLQVVFSHPLYIKKNTGRFLRSSGRFVKTENIQSATIRMLPIYLLKQSWLWSWKMHEPNRGPSVSADSLCDTLVFWSRFLYLVPEHWCQFQGG